MITKVNQKYGIKTTDSLVNFFYDNYPGETMKYFIIGGANYVDIGGSTPLDIEVTPKMQNIQMQNIHQAIQK